MAAMKVVEEEEVVVVVMVEKKDGRGEMLIVMEEKIGNDQRANWDLIMELESSSSSILLEAGCAISLPPFSSLRLRNYYYTTPQVEKIHMNLVRYKRRNYCDFGFDPSGKTS
ncbi:hypothetical protein NC652_016006 [Populus alba x Populus x berolinensis]|nr:hypothetical protein NC652_016006 [Populus alba x Populus x berolinensis]